MKCHMGLSKAVVYSQVTGGSPAINNSYWTVIVGTTNANWTTTYQHKQSMYVDVG